MSQKLKVLVFGNTKENLRASLIKAGSIHAGKHGPFNAVLILGGKPDDLGVPYEVPLDMTVYVVSESEDYEALNAVEGITVLKNGDIIKTLDGLKIGFVGNDNLNNNQETEENLVDILLSHSWPRGITTHSSVSLPSSSVELLSNGSADDASRHWHPRYHFATGGFWEREPFVSQDAKDADKTETSSAKSLQRLTRFISLGDYKGDSRWHYAFQLDVPLSDDEAVNPSIITANPYSTYDDTNSIHKQQNSQKRQREDQIKDTDFLDQNKRVQKPFVPINPGTCFLCLSNPALAKHLIVSIGEDVYIALAKGPLTISPAWHVLVVPIAHVPTFKALNRSESGLENPNASAEVLLEMAKYTTALRAMYMETINHDIAVFEIVKPNGIHIHSQVIPIPGDKIDLLKEEFLKRGARMKIQEKSIQRDGEENYFRISLGSAVELYIDLNILTGGQRGGRGSQRGGRGGYNNDRRNNGGYFDMQFPRKVIASVLGVEDRIDWRKCEQSIQEETDYSENFKKAFKKFDFTVA
ncbi:hypothetical protein NADFUDRAFT_51612 [Nadsonia fulvescens var. elongata DSM 6958]|uniref:Cwf19-like C-terminal domain-containing protein n=1 Tax=Nadsonia fulvescens var. elongata DSM 6958 TaxID=857566 RepID=A0A1E3PHX7_9ASCO|nr:hypothetical protein NADFUDRAFT_51612 [Nadsonia fulvescens var. elongata DSM 6958]